MKLWQSVKRIFTPAGPQPGAGSRVPPPAEPEPAELPAPPELAPAQVQQALAGGQPPLLLDVREPYERRQVRIPASLHIPMNDVPGRLDELPRDRPIVVYCAHGSRSYGVAAYLREQGLDAANLTGGITQWQRQGGAVDVG